MINYKIRIQYDGTRYKGWQRQKSTDQTIQGKIEAILQKQFGREIEIDGSGRTDAGVHAKGQVANFRLHKAEADAFERNPEAITTLLNTYLPEDIAVVETRIASERFHSRLNAVEKTYMYRIWNSDVPNVFGRRYMHQMSETLDIEKMKYAAKQLLGTHDFAAFCGNAKMKKSTVRTIYEIRIEKLGDEVRLTYRGNGFLQNMVRILTGTLIEVGLGKRTVDSMQVLLDSKTRSEAGAMMPACGLTLVEVKYD